MAGASGDPFLDPVHGLTMRFVAESGDRLEIETVIAPGGSLAEHFHLGIEERWRVLEGEIEIRRDGTWHRLTPAGGELVVASGQRHAVRNRSGRATRLHTVATPPRNLAGFITESAWAARQGLFNRQGLPTGPRGLAWATGFALRFRDETVVCRPPPALQSLTLPAVSRVTGRFEPRYPGR